MYCASYQLIVNFDTGVWLWPELCSGFVLGYVVSYRHMIRLPRQHVACVGSQLQVANPTWRRE